MFQEILVPMENEQIKLESLRLSREINKIKQTFYILILAANFRASIEIIEIPIY